MKELRSEVKSLVTIELERANEKFPWFNSDHEGVSAIREEMLESKADAESLHTCVDILETAVFCDFSEPAKAEACHNAEVEAIELACEAIQTAAMLRKFVLSKQTKNPADEPFSQEEADALVERNAADRAHKEEATHFIKILFETMSNSGKEDEEDA